MFKYTLRIDRLRKIGRLMLSTKGYELTPALFSKLEDNGCIPDVMFMKQLMIISFKMMREML